MNNSDSGKRELLRYTVATIAYRAGKAVRPPAGRAGNAQKEFGQFKVGETSRTPIQILAHIGDLFDWALALAKGKHDWHNSQPLPWDKEVERFSAALKAFDNYLASTEPLGFPAEKLFQGPIADALTHVGQITMLRRLAGSPVRGENYSKASIAVGRVGAERDAPRVEFD